uniref:NUBP iron-sulfur cluster assembly factor 2, cytosolic n=1 Tax=Saimiri boliviensis boliviensis TaxID=39432 RepID=A0A2K6RY19_SAIBB
GSVFAGVWGCLFCSVGPRTCLHARLPWEAVDLRASQPALERRIRKRALVLPGPVRDGAACWIQGAWPQRWRWGEKPGNLAGVRHIILVLSGKGGVGKSTISTELALALHHAGKKVGILDVDLCGPSIPRMLGAQGRAVHQCDRGWAPVFLDREQSISLMSVGFLLEKPDEAVVWRGPKKNALIKQFVSDVAWGELDFLVVDTPPGTSDEHMATVEALRPYQPLGALVVTTPQAVSVGDVRRELTFCRKTGLR